jgi:hypothetical protein
MNRADSCRGGRGNRSRGDPGRVGAVGAPQEGASRDPGARSVRCCPGRAASAACGVGQAGRAEDPWHVHGFTMSS